MILVSGGCLRNNTVSPGIVALFEVLRSVPRTGRLQGGNGDTTALRREGGSTLSSDEA